MAAHITRSASLSEIQFATVSVRDLDVSRRFYENVFAYVVHSAWSVAGNAYHELWRLPKSQTGKVLLMGPEGATSGLIRLVQFSTPGALYWDDYAEKNNYGHYALNIRVPDIHQATASMVNNGGQIKSEPTQWTVMQDLSAWDSMSFDPDRLLLDVFELETKPGSLLSDFDGKPTALQSVAVHVSDAHRSACFYAALGYRPLYDKMVRGMESFFKLPPGTDLHNINMMMPDAPQVGRLEIAQYVGWPGKSQRNRAVPPALGILTVSLQTTMLSETEKLLASIDAEPVGERVEIDVPEFGRVAARSYYGPDDELLEFYERI